MKTNEIFYKIQQALSLKPEEIVSIFAQMEYPLTKEAIVARLVRYTDKSFQECSYEELGIFLDGLIAFKRGEILHKEEKEVVLTNNLILKKLRIALELKESEIEIIFALVDIILTKQQIKSLFRKEEHKNFKICSDALLFSFLEGLDEFYYEGEEVL
jgi:uncharacterized protein YehS (DUF1456 family)